MAIYYLDADDEITSAASRIRDTSDSQVALVLTAGSRVATSRINFMLLAREARKRSKRLAIVTSDPSTQSVARSAELTVYGSVGEYERALAVRAAEAAAATANPSGAVGGVGIETSAALGELARTVAGGSGKADKGSPSRTAASASGPRRRVPWSFVAAGLAAVIILVSGGLFFIYPSATVALTLQEQQIGPLSLDVTVNPAASAVDDAKAVIPGLDKAFPVDASGSYPATGQHVDEAAATGTVTFTSINTVFAVPVLAGTQVSTASGIAFVTQQTVTVPRADFNTSTPGRASVAITAVKKGTAGNVPANSITRLSSDLASAQVSVTNPASTTGGTHTVSPEIQQSDIDAATTDLLAQLDSAFREAMAAPASHPSGSDLFSETARIGVAVCAPDPETLVGQAQDSFQLSCSATGTATIADLTNVTSLAERRIKSLVSTGYGLVQGSVQTSLGTPEMQGGLIVVPVTANASQVRQVSADQLRSGILGKSLDEARKYLAAFGSVNISMSPGWADKMPSFDFRIDLQVVLPTARATPSASAGPSSSIGVPPTTPTPRPPATPRRTVEPVSSTPATGPSESPSSTPAASESASPSPPASPAPTPTSTATATPTPLATPEPATPTPSPTAAVTPSSTP